MPRFQINGNSTFVQLLVRVNIKTTQLHITGSLCGECTGGRWIPLTKAQLFGKCHDGPNNVRYITWMHYSGQNKAKPCNLDDVIKWKHFPRYWTFVRGTRRSPVNSPHEGQWREILVFSVICAWINGWKHNREAGDLRRHRAHYDVNVMTKQRTYLIHPTTLNFYCTVKYNIMFALSRQMIFHDQEIKYMIFLRSYELEIEMYVFLIRLPLSLFTQMFHCIVPIHMP